jgi:hypothetical protein
VHAKLLTGGLVPLAATVASEAIYDVFLGDEKRDALLHGHSYTAHAVGCAVAEASVKELLRIEGGEEWEAFRAPWGKTKVDSASGGKDGVWSMWSPTFLDSVSRRTEVESVVALGSVLAIKLRDENPGMSSFLFFLFSHLYALIGNMLTCVCRVHVHCSDRAAICALPRRGRVWDPLARAGECILCDGEPNHNGGCCEGD